MIACKKHLLVISDVSRVLSQALTATVSAHSSLSHILQPSLINQPTECVKGASCFEGTDLLLVFAFEE